MAADGEHTVGQFVTTLGTEYSDGPPPALRAQVHALKIALSHPGSAGEGDWRRRRAATRIRVNA
jgi:hypothetical protein